MASISARLAKVEEAVAARADAEVGVVLDEFNAWRAVHWTTDDSTRWDRWLLSQITDSQLERFSRGDAAGREIVAQYAPLDEDELAALNIAWERVPADLRARLGIG